MVISLARRVLTEADPKVIAKLVYNFGVKGVRSVELYKKRLKRGESFMHPELLDFFGDHPDCYFQVFTNGQLITDAVARQLRRLGNVSPLISLEGTEAV